MTHPSKLSNEEWEAINMAFDFLTTGRLVIAGSIAPKDRNEQFKLGLTQLGQAIDQLRAAHRWLPSVEFFDGSAD